jgi:2-polyprenyl-3-methyl-5-hydroxy-6-metoxy-1,4-benzoquinol methylase
MENGYHQTLRRRKLIGKTRFRETVMFSVGGREAYERWHAAYAAEPETDAPWHRLVRKYLGESDLAGKKILEIGCGRGGFSASLAAHEHCPSHLVAADCAHAAVENGRKISDRLGLHNISWHVQDIQALAYADESFDTVISCETVEHVLEPRVAIRELARVLKRGGRLFLTTPNYLGSMGLYRVYRSLVGRPFKEEGQPVNNVTLLPATVGWLHIAGLRIVAVNTAGHYLPLPGRSPVRVAALDRAGVLTCWLGLHSLVVAQRR